MKGLVCMKYKILIVLVCILLFTNIGMGAYIVKDKILNRHETKDTKIESDINNNNSNSYFMMNPIDEYFVENFSNHKNEIEYRLYQRAYLDIWKTEYNKILKIIREKCIYEEDVNIINEFNEEIEESYDKLEPALLAVMLDNFEIPESPEKHSQGNGTTAKLDMYRGILYRNACMLFIEYIDDEYKFPDENKIADSIEKTRERIS